MTLLLTLCMLGSVQLARTLILPARRIMNNRLACVGTKFSPLVPSDNNENELYVRNAPTTIVPIAKELPLPRPSLITFDAFGTIIVPSQSIGRWYRECLNSHCDMRIRLPRPKLFTVAFKKAYSDRCKAYPCFGAKNGMSSRDWWYEVVKQTYRTTENLSLIDESELDVILPDLFETLYTEVFSTSKGWMVIDDAVYTLSKLKGWRDEGAGPKLGVISNFDNRLDDILTDLKLRDYFDFVLNSYDSKSEKPDRGMFDAAVEIAKASSSSAYHLGDNLDKDVSGAVAAGWTGMRFTEWFDEELPDWSSIEEESQADEGSAKRQALMLWGRRDTSSGLEWVELWGLDDMLTVFGFPDDDSKPVRTTYIRGFLDD